MTALPALSWILPGKGESDRHSDCGEFATWGHQTSDGFHWRRGRRGCGSYECPSNLASGDLGDYRWRNAYTTRQARRIVSRLGKVSQHGMISPPSKTPPASPEEYRKLRRGAYEILRAVGVVKAAIFPHPFRCVEADRTGGHDGFHFHFQTPCRIDPVLVRASYHKTGWVVKGFGFKPTLRVAIYELHHVGRMGRPALNPASKSNLGFVTEAVTWFGEWKRPLKPDSGGIRCPVCGEIVPVRDWKQLEWSGQGPPPGELCGVGGEWRLAPVFDRTSHVWVR